MSTAISAHLHVRLGATNDVLRLGSGEEVLHLPN
jgi:hypothetical protein